ncbi:hypothetical protein M2447_001851 [Ereboglobus sp. PH5-10]|uniref:outer membrane beta-barrel protein n=1 Tax=Ereboglobus sp. PH5-10 TaxID=2940629 RepID=UPI002406881D|nr:outer membrane beta-barrel protein [Ereboglobus sp. PH5-10]MDF9827752.1 hypothetical protein [Ereboglobus sp. PH5-10]
MNKNIIKVAGLALAAAFALSARADVAIHQNVSVYGYAAGSVQYTKPDKGNSDTEMDLDAAKLGLAFNFAPVTAKISVYADAGAKDLYVLEANATYDIGNGFSITGGRFQSWIGYEAFDIPNCNFITYGTDEMGWIIPNFHEGIRFDYALDKMSFGVAVVNSVYNIEGGYRGDGSLSDGYGVEGHFGYNDGALSIGATLAYQNTRDDRDYNYNPILYSDTYIADVWAQYVINNKTTIGAELFYSKSRENSNYNVEDYYGLVMVKQQFTEKLSLAGRVSMGQEKIKLGGSGKGQFWKLSAQPSYAVTQNLSVGAEVSYTKYEKIAKDLYGKSKWFAGVQAVFKF